jgi:glucose-6-phosphate isomerase
MSSSMSRAGESLGGYKSKVEAALQRLEREGLTGRIWAKDASVWKSDAAHQKIINNSLGWLGVARGMNERVDVLEAFAKEVRDAGFTHLMLLGMGGSSLGPEVFRRTFGKLEGSPELLVLDTTDPDTIAAFESRLDLERTLFIVSSKSGTTIEPLSFYKYFYDRVRSVKGERAGENFVAITDPDTLMERMARDDKFRRIFRNPADIGGRYSVLSCFGLVPFALMGGDTRELLRRVVAMLDLCTAGVPASDNEGARLGVIIGTLAGAGRDKLTLVADERLASLGLWIEQLIAESTGKEGKGVVPVAGETLAAPDAYGNDRLFVSIEMGEASAETERKLKALETAGHPVVRRRLKDALDLGAEFFVWEFATAAAGALLAIDPFDQPNVQESKDNTNALLEEFKSSGALPEQTLLASENDLKIYGAQGSATKDSPATGASNSSSISNSSSALKSTSAANSSLAKNSSSASGKSSLSKSSPSAATPATLASVIDDLIARVKAGDYIALLAYIQETDAHDAALQEIRTSLRDVLHVATTTGYGPRFLHSTGQLHKGGADNGVFIQLTDRDATDLKIPDEPYTFSVLKQAQALGDFSSLASRNRRAIRFDLGADAEAGLKKLSDLILDALTK